MERLIVWHRWCPPPEPSLEAVAQASLWRIQARERLTALGGEVIAELGGAIVVALQREQLTAALETCLALSHEVEQEENLEVGSVAHALTLGPVERTNLHSPLVGDCLDRAQALASYAAAGDVVLDQEAQTTHLLELPVRGRAARGHQPQRRAGRSQLSTPGALCGCHRPALAPHPARHVTACSSSRSVGFRRVRGGSGSS